MLGSGGTADEDAADVRGLLVAVAIEYRMQASQADPLD
jgi:hypothetical protein